MNMKCPFAIVYGKSFHYYIDIVTVNLLSVLLPFALSPNGSSKKIYVA